MTVSLYTAIENQIKCVFFRFIRICSQ